MTKPKTGKYTQKMYKCDGCGHEFLVGTNHWGAIYMSCPKCRCRGGALSSVSRCMEPCPDTHDLPPEWTMAKLGDIAEVKS